MSVRILRVQFRDPVHTGNRSVNAIGAADDHVALRREPDGVVITPAPKDQKAQAISIFVPNSNIVWISFEPEGQNGTKK